MAAAAVAAVQASKRVNDHLVYRVGVFHDDILRGSSVFDCSIDLMTLNDRMQRELSPVKLRISEKKTAYFRTDEEDLTSHAGYKPTNYCTVLK